MACSRNTDPTMVGPIAAPAVKLAFCATTPPHIAETNSTDAKGVNRLNSRANFGNFWFKNIPNNTGPNTTLAVAAHSAHPDTAVVPPTNNLTKAGVATTAKRVEHDVKTTDKATSAPAINVTRLDAVPPGEQPTKHNPKNNDAPT
eukprot:scaffold6829_cov171-Amphora_coffeaeformis.AAC.24